MKLWFAVSASTFYCAYENCSIFLYTYENYKPMNGFLWNFILRNFMKT